MTPVVAVLKSIKNKAPRAKIRFWCDKKFSLQAKEIMSNFDTKIPVQTIIAGKFRRYHHLTVFQQITWPSLVLKNFGDSFLVVIGCIQSFFKLIIWRPDVIFTKGGYVCLPVGVAAKLLNIPMVIHDSDAYPGLTNRILSKWAKVITTGAPLEFYSYPKDRSHYVGIPISEDFKQFSDAKKRQARDNWQLDQSKPLIVITGGGLGAKRINDSVAIILDELLKKYSVVLISGNDQYDELRSLTPPNSLSFQLHSFVSKDMYSLLGAADLVVTRAGATTILELASLAKPTILIPNAKLTGGHQIKNADIYQQKNAVIVVNEDKMVENPKILLSTIDDIINDKHRLEQLADNLAKFARPKAADEVADLILSASKK